MAGEDMDRHRGVMARREEDTGLPGAQTVREVAGDMDLHRRDGEVEEVRVMDLRQA